MYSNSKAGRFCAIFAAALLFGLSTGAKAAPVTELALVLDASGSIAGGDWTTQITGYSNALGTLLPTDGSVAVSVIRFATTATVVQTMTTINNVADRSALASFFLTLAQTGDGNLTCISCGIFEGLGTFSGSAARSIIDVSTDGYFNVGVDPDGPAGTIGTAEWAVANGATALNALGVGITPDFAHGPDSFTITSADFSDFSDAIALKIETEIQDPNPVPEPTTLALFGFGLAGLGAITRRRKTK